MSRHVIEVGLDEALQRFQAAQTGTWIDTYSNRQVDYLNFNTSDVSVDDIAHGLSNACRFAGQCDPWYSVAEHSVLVSKYVEYMTRHMSFPGIVEASFMHDVPETWLGDLPTPLKKLCPGFRLIEERFEQVVIEAFGLSVGLAHPIIRQADFDMYLRERAVLMPQKSEKQPDELDEILKVRCLNQKDAKALFLARMDELGIELRQAA